MVSTSEPHCYSRVVDEDVNPSESIDCRVDEVVEVLFLGQVRCHGESFHAERLDLGDCLAYRARQLLRGIHRSGSNDHIHTTARQTRG